MRALLSHLAEKGLTSVMVEGGPTVAGSFLDADCVDEVWAYIAPRILGGRAAPGSVAGNGVTALADAPCLTDVAWRAVGDDFKVTGRFLRPHLGDIAAESEGGRA